jgi:hypothetical protein
MTRDPRELADDVLAGNPKGSKAEWGRAMRDLAAAEGMAAYLEAKLIETLGNYVSGRKASNEQHSQVARLAGLEVSHTGRPLSPTISVRRPDGARQLVLWIDATPQQFIDAVFRQQNTIDGLQTANSVRFELAAQMQADESLLALPTLRAVCDRLDLDPDTLGLDELEEGAAS